MHTALAVRCGNTAWFVSRRQVFSRRDLLKCLKNPPKQQQQTKQYFVHAEVLTVNMCLSNHTGWAAINNILKNRRAQIFYSYIGKNYFIVDLRKIFTVRNMYQRTNGPVNANLISRPSISTKHTKPGKTRSRNESLIFIY